MTTNKIKYSFIIPTYNRSSILKICVEYLVQQKFPSNQFEIVIIDNNSRDNTATVSQILIAEFKDHKIRYFKEMKQGLVYARHRGAREASGDVLIFTDDDAYWMNHNNLEVIDKSFLDYPEIAGVSGKIKILWDKQPDKWMEDYEGCLGKIDLSPNSFIMNDVLMYGAHYVIKKETLFKLEGFHPDQIFEHLIGDGETGLCRKLTQNGIKILWQPQSEVYHFQLKDKNGTFIDIQRRFANNGCAKGYEAVTEFKNLQRLKLFLVTCITYIRTFRIIIKKKLKQIPVLHDEFQLSYSSALIKYMLKYYFIPSFRRKILNTDWKLRLSNKNE